MKLYASVGEVDNNSKIVLTKIGKIVISKEPLSMLLRLLVNSLNSTIFLWIQHGTSRYLAVCKNLYTDRF